MRGKPPAAPGSRTCVKLLGFLAVGVLLLAGCGTETAPNTAEPDPPTTSETTPGPLSASPAQRIMPDLIGLPAVEAATRIGTVAASSDWGGPVHVRCQQRPSTVAWQRPAAGTPMSDDVVVEVRLAALDLEEFRGPCEPVDGDLRPVTGSASLLAREFYRFAADPSRGAPFVRGPVWVGIEDGLFSTTISGEEVAQLSAWELQTTYAERIGPFSALDVLAGSGGYYELRRGVDNNCFTGDAEPPPALEGVRAISLTASSDVFSSCMEWWAVTLFLDPQDRIAGVALRLGAP